MAYLILVGMMGSGKSTVGRVLADRLDLPFFDTDKQLERELGRSVKALFQVFGEDAFRDHETRLLRDWADGEGVISTGGGIVLREENWEQMRRLGVTVYLEADAETLKERLRRARAKRPLLAFEDWESRLEELLRVRQTLYEKADFRVASGLDDPDVMADRVMEALGWA